MKLQIKKKKDSVDIVAKKAIAAAAAAGAQDPVPVSRAVPRAAYKFKGRAAGKGPTAGTAIAAENSMIDDYEDKAEGSEAAAAAQQGPHGFFEVLPHNVCVHKGPLIARIVVRSVCICHVQGNQTVWCLFVLRAQQSLY